jgi:hypothetical protein
MIPIPDLKTLNYIWPDLKTKRFPLHGLLLFAHADHYFPEYLDASGISDLEAWTSPNCVVLLLRAPSSHWIDYAKRNENIWWQLFGSTSTILSASAADSAEAKVPREVSAARRVVVSFPTKNKKKFAEFADPLNEKEGERPSIAAAHGDLEAVKNEPVLVIDGVAHTIADIFSPCKDQYLQMHELQTFLYRFNRPPTNHPCIIFFKDYLDSGGWFIDLGDLLNLPKKKLRESLKEWFSSPPFLDLVTEAKRA